MHRYTPSSKFTTTAIVLMCSLSAFTAWAQDCPELEGRWPFGPSNAVEVSGNYAYYGSGAVLRVVDVSVITHPTVVAELELPDVIVDITVSGSYAYVADRSGGLRVVDVGTPSSPIEVAARATPGRAATVVVSGNLAYLADLEGGLRVFNVGSPNAPVEIGSYDPPGFEAVDIELVPPYAYVTDFDDGLRVIDVSTPSSPVQVGSLSMGYSFGLAVWGNYAYVGHPTCLDIVNVSNPHAPKVEKSYEEPFGGIFYDVVNDGPRVYIADSEFGIRFVDLLFPDNPRPIWGHPTPGEPSRIALKLSSGRFAFLADGSGGLRIVSLLLTHGVDVASLDGAGWSRGVATDGNYAYLVGQYGGLRIVDVTSPGSPVEIGFYDSSEDQHAVDVSDGYAYVAESRAGLRVIDVTPPGSPVTVGTWDTPGYAFDVEVSDGYAYVADSTGGLRVISVASPSSPVEVGWYATPAYAQGVAVADGYAYVADHSSGLRVIDVSTPSSPVEVGACDTPGLAYGVAVSGGYAYVADYFEGLRVIDVSDPAAPVEVGSYDTPGRAYDVAVSGGFVYVADDEGGVRVIDVTTPTSPFEVGFNDPPFQVMDVAVAGGQVYAATDSTGLAIFSDADHDCDGTDNAFDTCPEAYNPDQGDVDGDGAGDLCDVCPSDATDACDPAGSAAESLGVGGGSVTNPDGTATVDVPLGALSGETSISITGYDPADADAGFVVHDGVIPVGEVFDFKPELGFGDEVTITLGYEQGAMAECGAEETSLDIYRWDGADWIPQGAAQDCAANTLSLLTDHFSFYLVALLDGDADGVPDALDDCPSSDLASTVVIDGCDSGVANHMSENGCTISDAISACLAGATNHGRFISCVSELTDALVVNTTISDKEKGKIQRCAARARLP
jgi:hypothetical protein